MGNLLVNKKFQEWMIKAKFDHRQQYTAHVILQGVDDLNVVEIDAEYLASRLGFKSDKVLQAIRKLLSLNVLTFMNGSSYFVNPEAAYLDKELADRFFATAKRGRVAASGSDQFLVRSIFTPDLFYVLQEGKI